MPLRRVVSSLCIAVALAAPVRAADAPLAVGKGDGVPQILAARTGTLVTLHVGDEEITGTVKAVGDQLVHLERLGGKDFFDAAVRLDRIDAVVVRVRSN